MCLKYFKELHYFLYNFVSAFCAWYWENSQKVNDIVSDHKESQPY